MISLTTPDGISFYLLTNRPIMVSVTDRPSVFHNVSLCYTNGFHCTACKTRYNTDCASIINSISDYVLSLKTSNPEYFI